MRFFPRPTSIPPLQGKFRRRAGVANATLKCGTTEHWVARLQRVAADNPQDDEPLAPGRTERISEGSLRFRGCVLPPRKAGRELPRPLGKWGRQSPWRRPWDRRSEPPIR